MAIDEQSLVDAAPALQLLPVGDTAWTVEFGKRIDPALHARVLGLAGALDAARKDGANKDLAAIVDVVPTFRSLTVHYNPLACDGERLGEAAARNDNDIRRLPSHSSASNCGDCTCVRHRAGCGFGLAIRV